MKKQTAKTTPYVDPGVVTDLGRRSDAKSLTNGPAAGGPVTRHLDPDTLRGLEVNADYG